jgi:hypothetical protein
MGSEHKLTDQGTKTTKYEYAVVEFDSKAEAVLVAAQVFGDGFWIIDWNEWREEVEIKNPNAEKVTI